MQTLKVGGHIYEIKHKRLTDAVAETEYDTATIYLHKDIVVQSIKESAFFHEIFHTCNSSFGQDGAEHGLIDSLAEQIYAVLIENNLLNTSRMFELTN